MAMFECGINSNLGEWQDISGQIVFQNTWDSGSSTKVYKNKNMCFATFIFQNGKNPSSVNEIFVSGLPHPKTDVMGVAWITTEAGIFVKTSLFNITSDGKLKCNQPLDFKNTLYASVMYAIQ